MDRQAVYVEWVPDPNLRRFVRCSWAGRFAADGTPYADSVLPDGCIDVVWDGARLFVAGPDTRPVPMTRKPSGSFVGIRFWPGQAPTFLKVPASELRDLRVDAADILGDRAKRLSHELARAPSLRAAALHLERAMVRSLPEAGRPDGVIEAAVAFLRESTLRQPIGPLAARLGMSERQLHHRFTTRVGYGPKMLHRVFRFRRFLSLMTSRPDLGLAEMAALSGYADQAHLTRETQRLAGASPGSLDRPPAPDPSLRE